MGKCERCGGRDSFTDANGVERLNDFTDYCAKCGKNLCKKCMANGCCEARPAISGMADDSSDDENLVVD
jgi:hypothetical protein